MPLPGVEIKTRAPIDPPLPRLTRIALPDPVAGPLRISGAQITKVGAYCSLGEEVTFDHCLIDAKISPRKMLTISESLIATMLDGVGFNISGSRIGSITRPDGSTRKVTEDGLRACPVPGSPPPPPTTYNRSLVIESDIVNTDPRTLAHQDGVQLWWGGNLAIVRTKITGWWQSAIMLKSDYGVIDDVLVESCYLAGADYFQIRAIDGGFGRPRRLTIRDVACESGTKGGRHPINTGDDLCSDESQTKYVRSEAERLDPTWVVYSGVTDGAGCALPPSTGWYDPASKTYSYSA